MSRIGTHVCAPDQLEPQREAFIVGELHVCGNGVRCSFQIGLVCVEHDCRSVAVELAHQVKSHFMNSTEKDVLLCVHQDPGLFLYDALADLVQGVDHLLWDGLVGSEGFRNSGTCSSKPILIVSQVH